MAFTGIHYHVNGHRPAALPKTRTGKLPFVGTEVAGLQEREPTYKELQEVLRKTPSANSSKSLAERLQSEFAFNRDSLKQ